MTSILFSRKLSRKVEDIIGETMVYNMTPENAIVFIKKRTGVNISKSRYKDYIQFMKSKEYFDTVLTDKVQYQMMAEHLHLYNNLKAYLNQINRTLLVNYAIDPYQVDTDKLTKLILTADQVIQTMVKMNLIDPVFAKFKYSIENNLIIVKQNNNNDEQEQNDNVGWEQYSGDSTTIRTPNIVTENIKDKIDERLPIELSTKSYTEFDRFISRNGQENDTSKYEQGTKQDQGIQTDSNEVPSGGTEKRIRTRDEQHPIEGGTGATEKVF